MGGSGFSIWAWGLTDSLPLLQGIKKREETGGMAATCIDCGIIKTKENTHREIHGGLIDIAEYAHVDMTVEVPVVDDLSEYPEYMRAIDGEWC